MNDNAQPDQPDKKYHRALERLASAEEALAQARQELANLEQSKSQTPNSPDNTQLPLVPQAPYLEQTPNRPKPGNIATTFPISQSTYQSPNHINLANNPLPHSTFIVNPPDQPTSYHPTQSSYYAPPPHPPSAPPHGLRESPAVMPAQSARKPSTPWWTNEQTIIRLVGFFGAAVTFAGIAFLVSLGIEHGILGRTARVILSAVLGVILLAATFVMRQRKFHPVAVGVALTTSLLVLGATVIALGFIMALWPVLIVTFLLPALILGYSALPYSWQNENQAIALSLGGFALLLWHLYYEYNPEVFPYSLAGLALMFTAYRRSWKTAEIIAAILTIVGTFLGDLANQGVDRIGFWLAGTMLVTIILRAHISVPILLAVFSLSFSTPETFALILLVCIVWLLLTGSSIPLIVLPMVFILLIGALNPSDRFGGLIGFYLTVAAVTFYFSYKKPKGIVWLVWILCSLFCSVPLALHTILELSTSLTGYKAISVAVAIGIMLVCTFINRATVIALTKPLPVTIALVGLYFSMLLVVTITMEISTTHGFLLGHALTSIAWIILAAALLIGRKASLGVGITLAIAAITKLVLYDMAALSGLPRVSAFLFSGLMLIIIAALRGKSMPPQPITPMAAQLNNLPPNSTVVTQQAPPPARQ